MESGYRELVIFQTLNGIAPFETWLNELRDIQARAVIRKRLNRIRLGNIGDYKSIGDGAFELRIDFGPGYRVYFGIQSKIIIVLLCGGDKSSQEKDIQKAKEYWNDFLS